jgi:hypothetical protein
VKAVIFSLRDYMREISLRGFKNCEELLYRASDKDCGYLSGLRYLGIAQSKQTDDIAQEMIYGKNPQLTECEQMNFLFQLNNLKGE